jgi:hypothetical protein
MIPEWIFVICLAVGFLAIPAAFRQWWLFLVFLLFFICFGTVEVIANKVSGMTVSEHFWALRDKSKVSAIVIAVNMLVAWLALLWHFMVK